MRILYLITKIEIGGAQIHVHDLMEDRKKRGDQVALMSYPGGWLEKEARARDIRFYPNTYFSNTFRVDKGIKAMKEIRKAVEDFKPQIIHCHSTWAGFWGRITIQNKVPMVFTVHGSPFGKGMPWIRSILGMGIEKIASRYCSKIICVSEYDRKLFERYHIAPDKKLVTIHNGIAIENIKKIDKGNSFLRIVFIGRMAAPKNQMLLLQSLELLQIGRAHV